MALNLATNLTCQFLSMEHNKDYDYFMKITVMGDPGSGKTWFIRRTVDQLIPLVDQYQPLDDDFKIKTITEPETNKIIKIQLWKHKEDRFRSVYPGALRGTSGIILTVDVTSRDSLNSLKQHFQIIDRYASEKAKVLVIATKSDDSTQRKVFTEEILELIEKQQQEEYWTDHDLQFIETSAKDDYNVNEALQTITRSILMRLMEEDEDDRPITIIRPDDKKEKPRCIVM